MLIFKTWFEATVFIWTTKHQIIKMLHQERLPPIICRLKSNWGTYPFQFTEFTEVWSWSPFLKGLWSWGQIIGPWFMEKNVYFLKQMSEFLEQQKYKMWCEPRYLHWQSPTHKLTHSHIRTTNTQSEQPPHPHTGRHRHPTTASKFYGSSRIRER